MLHIGHVCKSHGIDGQFSIKLIFPIDLCRKFKNLNTIYLENKSIPLQINSITLNNSIYLKTTVVQIKSKEEAKSILRKNIFIKYGDHIEIDAEIKKLNEFLKFTIIDENSGEIGMIINIDYNRPQKLFTIQSKKNTILIPFVEELIHKIDYENQKIYTQLPEGLIEICGE